MYPSFSVMGSTPRHVKVLLTAFEALADGLHGKKGFLLIRLALVILHQKLEGRVTHLEARCSSKPPLGHLLHKGNSPFIIIY